ncbi:P-loop containing nucleoside triphosphate hydrolase protein [Aspergillus unguis]
MALEAEEVSRDTPPVAIEGRGVLGPISSVLEEQREFSCNGRDSTRPLRERIDNHGPPVLYILSPILLNALKAVICFQSPPDSFQPRQYNTNLIESRLENRRFVYPFTDLIHHRQRLLEYREEVKDSHDSGYSETCRQHIDILLKYLDDQLSGALKDVPLMLSQTTPEITFSALWTLLKPGSDVYVREDGKLNAYVIESCRNADGFSWSSLDAYATAYCVTVWNLNFDGQYLTRSVKEVTVPVFDGQRAIKSLPVIPIEYQQDESLRKTLIDRGKRFVDMMKEPALREYNGRSKLQGLGDYNRARVVIDHTTEPWTLDSVKERTSEKDIYVPVTTVEDVVLGKYIRMPKCPCQTCHDKETHQQRRVFDDYDNIDLQRTTTLTDHQYMLCASHVYGFVLKDRVWDVLEVDRLEFPRIQANIIDMLVMKPDSNKQMIKAICEIYGGSYRQAFSSDFVQGKGEGQILLLHGPPGTGKTLTAESVAEYTARPLLSITAADLGHEPVTLEKNLLRFFRNAKRWNAIVLLDEADVYLESRSSHDLQRNSIVSIFLRALDYFQGILFLTTNRVGNFDEAFMSRIHVQIGYDPLDEASRQQIWDNHFKKISRNHETHGLEIRVSYDVKEFVRKSQDLKVLKWNGREIRNAFQTALALACFQAKREGNPVPELTDEHLRQVVNMSQNFKNYLRNTRGGTEEDLALAWNVRNDAVRASG